MKVAYLVNVYPSVSHTFIRREIAALERQGIEVVRLSIRPAAGLVDGADLEEQARTHVLLSAGLSGLIGGWLRCGLKRPRRSLRAGLQALRIGVGSDRGVLRHMVYWAEACVLERLLREHGCTHLHAHFATNPAAVALLTRTLGGPSFSVTVHGQKGLDLPGPRSLREKVRSAAFVVGVSGFHRTEIERRVRPEDHAKIHVVHCGLDDSFLAAPQTPVPEPPRLVYVGRLSPEKAPQLLLAAAALLVKQGLDFRLAIVGDGPLRPQVEAQIRDHGLSEHVELLGYQAGERVRAELQAARALVLCSFKEGLPVVIMEAMAMSRPVVSTAIAGIPELVVPGETGWLVPAGDVDALAGALAEVLRATPAALTELGAAGRRRVLERHDIDRSAESLGRLFSDA